MSNSTKPLFATSDWHIGHEKSLEYDQRPFKNLEDMHRSLISRYNSTVPDNGVCYFAGDIGNKPEDIRKVITQLRGIKVCVLGNHDQGMTTMYNCGFDLVVWGVVLYIGSNRVTISHCPLLDVRRENLPNHPDALWHGHERPKHRQCSFTDEGQYHLHGHIHSRKGRHVSNKIQGNQYDIGAPANDYRPVSFSTITSWIAKDQNTKLSLKSQK